MSVCAWCPQGLWFLTLKLGLGVLLQTKYSLMSNVSIFDCNIPLLNLYPPFSILNCTAETWFCVVFPMFMRAITVQPERKIGQNLAFL